MLRLETHLPNTPLESATLCHSILDSSHVYILARTTVPKLLFIFTRLNLLIISCFLALHLCIFFPFHLYPPLIVSFLFYIQPLAPPSRIYFRLAFPICHLFFISCSVVYLLSFVGDATTNCFVLLCVQVVTLLSLVFFKTAFPTCHLSLAGFYI